MVKDTTLTLILNCNGDIAMAGDTVAQDFSVIFTLGEGLDDPSARQAVFEERAPQDGMGVLREQPGLPLELILITDEAEAMAVVDGGNTTKDSGESVGSYSADFVTRGGVEYVVTSTGLHVAITAYKRAGHTSDTDTFPASELHDEA